MIQAAVTRVEPRTDAIITLPDNSAWSAPVNTPLEAYFRAANPELIPMLRSEGSKASDTIVAALIDGNLRELTFPMMRDASVSPVLLRDGDGLRIYRRALSFLMVVAAEELFPNVKITVDHSLPFGGYYCAVVNREPFTPDELKQIKQRMLEIVEADDPITRSTVPLDEAIEIFKQRGDEDKVRLMETRVKNFLVLYELRGVKDYFFGYMLPSTGYLKVFDLSHDGTGFILHYPRRRDPNALQPPVALPKLRAIFKEAGEWNKLLGVEDIGELNRDIRSGRTRELILAAEALHESRIADMAHTIIARRDVKLVLLAGPTSSGKTTSSKRLAVQLLAHGLKPYTLGLDNYFVDRDFTPRDEKGDFDFEHLHAVDLGLLSEQLNQLMDCKEVQIPEYNFFTGKKDPGVKVKLTPEHVIIVEGIHGLNPELVQGVPNERVFRLYVSCLTQLNIDRHNRVPTTDVRLLRRIVRDAAFRGYTAEDTLRRWPSVREGERKWIFPYQENADVMFNSALVYELAVLRPLAEPLLRQVDTASPHYVETKRLLSFLSWVHPLARLDLIPDNSLLREFVGGSILADYTPGLLHVENGSKDGGH
jgi:uridine kinase